MMPLQSWDAGYWCGMKGSSSISCDRAPAVYEPGKKIKETGQWVIFLRN